VEDFVEFPAAVLPVLRPAENREIPRLCVWDTIVPQAAVTRPAGLNFVRIGGACKRAFSVWESGLL